MEARRNGGADVDSGTGGGTGDGGGLGPTQSERFVYLTTEDVASRPVIARILGAGLRQCRTDNDTSTPPTVGCIN